MTANVERAREFLFVHGRLLDRRLFEVRFEGGPSEDVVHALRAYQNDDGGFGNALEADLRGPTSQPIHVDMAFRYLHEGGAVAPEMVARACSFLASVSSAPGGVPAILPSALRYPRAEHWTLESWTSDTVNPTAMIAGLLHAMRVAHVWLDTADSFIWRRLDETRIEDGPALAAVFAFLNHVADRRKAVAYAEKIADAIPDATFFTIDPPPAEPHEYAHTPLDLAPWPDAMASGLFAPELIDAHLDRLEQQQCDDGGWPITWSPPGPAAVLEWRGRWTVQALITLQNYGRL